MRAYLIPRLERLLGRTIRAVLLSSVLFAAYHIYQGYVGALWALVFGLLAAAVCVWLRRIWPIFVMHFVSNLAAYGLFGAHESE